MKSVAQLLTALQSTDEIARVEAAKALGGLRTQPALDQAIPALCILLRESRDSETRWAAAYALTWTGDKRAIMPLLGALRDQREEPRVRGQAAEGLGEALVGGSDDAALDVLLDSLRSPAPEVRFWSAFALGKIGDRRAIPELERLAAHDHAVVPGWWSVSKEATAAIAAIAAR